MILTQSHRHLKLLSTAEDNHVQLVTRPLSRQRASDCIVPIDRHSVDGHDEISPNADLIVANRNHLSGSAETGGISR